MANKKVKIALLINMMAFLFNADSSEDKTIVVAGDGSGDFKTVQEAIASVSDYSAARTIIHLKPGVYQGQIVLPKSKPNVTFEGELLEKTVLTFALNTNEPNPPEVNQQYKGTGVVILSDGFRAEKVTFQNTSGDHGQALALRIDGDRAIVKDCRLLGWQDTLMVNNGRQYFTNCYIEGRVDFIYGSGTTVFDRCTIHSKNGGYVTASSTPQDHPYGFVFFNCKLTGDDVPWKDPTGAKPAQPDKKAYLGRPWRPYGSVAFINCEMGDHIRPEGWNNWGKSENEKTARYAEFNSSGPGANAEKRAAWSRQVTKDEAAKITVSSVLGGADNWNPNGFSPLPADYLPPKLPMIPEKIFRVADYGNVQDKGDITKALQAAVNAGSAGGGGRVEIPPGEYLCGPIRLASGINIFLANGALVKLLEMNEYPGGTTEPPDFFSGDRLHDVAISGAGTIDGQGAAWWPLAKNAGAKRPIMIRLNNCERLLIEGVTLRDSPMFHIAIAHSEDITVRGVTIRAPASTDAVNPSHNTDACDVSGQKILIQDCDISVGDDNYTCGGGTSNVLITHCTYGNGHGVSIGSHTRGGVSNITVTDCTFKNTDCGIRIKSDRDRGGVVEKLTYRNLRMTNVGFPILIYGSYMATEPRFRKLNDLTAEIAKTYPAEPIAEHTPVYRDIVFSNIIATTQKGRRAGLIWGLPESHVKNVLLENVSITADKPFGVFYAEGVRVVNSKIVTPDGVKPIVSTEAQITETP